MDSSSAAFWIGLAEVITAQEASNRPFRSQLGQFRTALAIRIKIKSERE